MVRFDGPVLADQAGQVAGGGVGAGRYLPPGQGPDLAVQQRLVALDDRD